MLHTVTRPPDLAARIRRAREDLGLTQAEVAKRVTEAAGMDKPIHYRTVQGWEAGRHPRHTLSAIERVLGIDLTTPPDTGGPTLSEFADAQLVAELAGRLAERDAKVRALTMRVSELEDAGTVVGSGHRWAARENHDT